MTQGIRYNGKDRDILAALAEHRFLTARQYSELSGRDLRSTQSALKRLDKAGVLRRSTQPIFMDGVTQGFAYSVAQHGRTVAQRRGWSKPPRVESTSALLLPHELAISDFQRLLEAGADGAGFDHPFFERKPSVLRYTFEEDSARHTINPDALIRVNLKDSPNKRWFFFVEVERGRQGDYQDGESNRQRKVRKYRKYHDGYHSDRHLAELKAQGGVRTLWIVERESQRIGFLNWLWSSQNKVKMFCVTTEADYHQNPYGPIWFRPTEWNPSEPESSPRHSLAELLK